ncbi:MAG: carbohydrate ABC transporter substrate-binding protein [Treponema sp.]|nr:carbohydrate ABC transporter substrate-binding protein [Treponema sp.]
MKKSLITFLLSLFLSCLYGQTKEYINVWSFTYEVPEMIELYKTTHPEFKYEISTTIVTTLDDAYQFALDQALMNGGKDAPDIYTAEVAFVLKYTKGDMQEYAMPYADLGIDVAKAIKDGGVAAYTVDIGTNTKGEVNALCYQATGGAFIYRRSLAKQVLGTDDPAKVAELIGAGTGEWDKFLAVGQKFKDAGIALVSGDEDMWHAVENSAEKGWVVDGKLYIDPKREAFLDIAKKLKDDDLSNNTRFWWDAWFDDIKGEGKKPCFGFFGPAWLINYTLAQNCGGTKVGEGTFGDWAICPSPVGFFWGGTWIFANAKMADEKKDAVKNLIEWITLDTSTDGLQYQWANGFMNEEGTKDTVGLGTVMAKSDGTLPFLNGQNMFDTFIQANRAANGRNLSEYDEIINLIWLYQVHDYVSGVKSRAEAIADFKVAVADKLGLEY